MMRVSCQLPTSIFTNLETDRIGTALLTIQHCSLFRFTQFKSATGRTCCGELRAHFLYACGKGFNLLLLRVNLPTRFEKLVEQHRVHCFIAHSVSLALFVTSH